MKYELESYCRLFGQNNLNHYKKIENVKLIILNLINDLRDKRKYI